MYSAENIAGFCVSDGIQTYYFTDESDIIISQCFVFFLIENVDKFNLHLMIICPL